MALIKMRFSRKMPAFLAMTFSLVGIAFLVSVVLSSVSSYWRPVTYDFQSIHSLGAGFVDADELQRRVDMLIEAEPRVMLARISDQIDAYDFCNERGLGLQVTIRAMVHSGSDIYHQLVKNAEQAGLGPSCGSTSISVTPSRGDGYSQGLLAIFVLMFVWRSRHGRHAFGVNWSDWIPRVGWLSAICWGLLCGAAAMVLTYATVWMVSQLGVENDASSYWDVMASESWLALVALVVIAAPIYEEFFYRAWMMERLTRVVPAGVALVVSAGAFAAVHMPQSPMHWAQLLLAGLMLGAIWWRFRSFISCVVAHAVANSISLGLYWSQLDH